EWASVRGASPTGQPAVLGSGTADRIEAGGGHVNRQRMGVTSQPPNVRRVSPPSSDDAATLTKESGDETPGCGTATVPVAQQVENVTQSTWVGPLQSTPKPCGSVPLCQVSP